MQGLLSLKGRVRLNPLPKGQVQWSPTLALISVLVFTTWLGTVNGGYFVGSWAPVALLVAGLLLLASFGGVRPSRPGLLALGLLAAYAVWTLASFFWSPNQGEAWDGTGQTLLYLVGFWVCLALVGLGASRRWVLAASVLGPAFAAALTLPALAPRLEELFENGRLEGSVGYYNGEAAFLLVPFWVAIYLGGSRRVNPFVRGAVLGGTVLSLSLATLTQSRGAMVAMAISAVVFFLLSGRRLRGLLALFPVAVALSVAFPGLNGVYQASIEGGNMEAALGEAIPIVWLVAGGTFLYGLLWGLIDRWWRPPTNLTRLAGGVALVCVALALFGGAGALYEHTDGEPVAFVEKKWEAFKTNDTSGAQQSRYLSASGSGRFTLWEVALEDFRSHPLLGVGTYNYETTYYQLRDESVGYVRQPHSLPLEVAAERGVVGGVLFLGFLAVCAGTGLWKRFKKLRPEGKAQAGALLTAASYWGVHASADWFWQLPAVTIIAFVYLGLLVAPWERSRGSHEGQEERGGVVARRALSFGGVGAAVITMAVIAPLYVSDFYLQKSYSAENPKQALSAVERAQRFNPFDPRLARREAELAAATGATERAEESYKRAIQLNPDHYAPYFLLGNFYEVRGEFEKAQDYYQKALERNPLDPEVKRGADRLQKTGPGPEEIDQLTNDRNL